MATPERARGAADGATSAASVAAIPSSREEAPLGVLHVGLGSGNSDGVRKAVAELTSAQAALGHDVVLHLSGPDHFDDFEDAAARPSVEIVRSPFQGPSILGYSPRGRRYIASPAAAQCSILHQHAIWPAHSRLTQRWRAMYGRPTVLTPHGSLQRHALEHSAWKKRLALAAYESRNMRDASCLQATAEQEMAAFRDFGLRNPVAIIPNAASDRWLAMSGDGDRFRVARGLPRGVPMVLYMSRIHPGKNVQGLIDAMARVGEGMERWHLVVAGPTEPRERAYHARVVQSVASHGLDSRVHWVGELHGQDKRDAFAAASLFVLPTLSDNFAIAVVEALACGLPVITTQGALPWSLLQTHGCGWWVPATTSHITKALRQATRMTPERLRIMGRRGRSLVERQFRWNDVARQTTQLYRWLLGQEEQPDFVVLD